MNNIHPIFDRTISREAKEKRLMQKSRAIWLTGLSGSGKSTIAIGLEKKLFQEGYFCQLLDGDNTRMGISNNLSFTNSDRLENIRRVAEISHLFVQSGIVVLNSFISPTHAIRQMAKDIIGEENFLEVYIQASFDVCEQRDVKGLYKKARQGEIANFTGLDAPYEEPESPFATIDTESLSINDSVDTLYQMINPLIRNSEVNQ